MKKAKDFIIRYFLITIGAILYAISISLFLNPHNLAPGGISGIAIIIRALIPQIAGVGMIIIVINIPILILGIWKFGIKFVLSSVYTLIVSSVLIDVIPSITNMDVVTNDVMLSSVIGGALFGFAMGMMFRLETTTAGMDIIVKLIRQYKPHLKTGQIYILLDIVILVASAVAFENVEVAFFATIALYISTVVMDKTIYGADQATLVYIVSSKRKKIANRMLEEINVGVTLIKAQGAYRENDTEVIMCVMKKQQLVRVRNILKEEDPDAFMIISSANEVFGEGFKDPFKVEI